MDRLVKQQFDVGLIRQAFGRRQPLRLDDIGVVQAYGNLARSRAIRTHTRPALSRSQIGNVGGIDPLVLQ